MAVDSSLRNQVVSTERHYYFNHNPSWLTCVPASDTLDCLNHLKPVSLSNLLIVWSALWCTGKLSFWVKSRCDGKAMWLGQVYIGQLALVENQAVSIKGTTSHDSSWIESSIFLMHVNTSEVLLSVSFWWRSLSSLGFFSYTRGFFKFWNSSPEFWFANFCHQFEIYIFEARLDWLSLWSRPWLAL
jgi:hypothetical protein